MRKTSSKHTCMYVLCSDSETGVGDSKRVTERDAGRLQKRRIVTRGELLRSARYVFARDGFEHARLEDIALRARKTRGAFYDNFKDKDDVFLAIFEEDVARDLTELGPLLLALPTIEQRIKALAEYIAALSEDVERTLLSIEFKLYAIRHPRKRKRLADLYRAMKLRTSVPEISRLLQQLDEPTMRVRFVDTLAICGIMDGLALNHLFDPEGLNRGALVRYLRLSITEALPPTSATRLPRKL